MDSPFFVAGSTGNSMVRRVPRVGLPLQSAAQGLDALAHAAQAVAFDGATAAAVVLNFKAAGSIDRRQPQQAISRSERGAQRW